MALTRPPVNPPIPSLKPAVSDAAFPLPGHRPPSDADRVTAAVRAASGLPGGSFAALLTQARQESNLNPTARNRKSSAVGPFQFLERTWLDMVRRHGAAYGLGSLASAITVKDGAPRVANPELRKEILALRQDPDLAAGMAARYLSECRDRLSHGLGRPATETEAHIAYVMGPRGAAHLIRAAETTPAIAAKQILPAAAAANHGLFHHPSGAPMTAGEVVAALKHRIDAAQLKLASLVPADPTPEVNDGPELGPAPVLLGQEVDQQTG